MREENWTESDSLYRRWFASGEAPLHERAVIAFVRRDTSLLQQVLREAPANANRRPGLGALAIGRYFRELVFAEQLARGGLTQTNAAPILTFHRQVLADIALARGQRRAGRQELLAAENHSAAARVYRALHAVVPFLPPENDEIEELLHVMRRGSGVTTPAPTAGPELERALAPHRHLYLIGLLSSAAGEYDAAEAIATELDALARPAPAEAVVRALAQTVRADVAWRQGRFREALSALETVRGEIPSDLLMSPYYAQEHARFLRADSYQRTGKYREALDWLRYGFQGTPGEVFYMAPVHLRLGETYDALGEQQLALRHYGLAVSLWSSADQDVQLLLDRARTRMNELRTR